jgi:hypothetical protein
MSNEQFGRTTRRTFIGTATVATAAASLARPTAAEEQTTGRVNSGDTMRLAEANPDLPEPLAARQGGRLDKARSNGHPQGRLFQA